jgi:hypothetical protein
MFWVVPLIGGAIGGGLYRMVFGERAEITAKRRVRAYARVLSRTNRFHCGN